MKIDIAELTEKLAAKPYIVVHGQPTEYCPVCNSAALHEDEQPQPGTHGYSILYKCGTRVDTGYSSDMFYVYQKCKL